MANLECLKKHSINLKQAKKKANSLEAKLKRAKENLASKETVITDECRSDAEVVALSLIEMTNTHDAMDKALAKKDKVLKDLVEIQKVDQGPVYQQVFDRGWNMVEDHYVH